MVFGTCAQMSTRDENKIKCDFRNVQDSIFRMFPSSNPKKNIFSGLFRIAFLVFFLSFSPQVQAQAPYQAFKSLGTSGHCLSGMIQDTNSWLYGTVYPDGGPGGVFKVSADGASFTVLHNFNPVSKDGSQSTARLMLAGNTLFGTTKSGGSNNFGTIFRVNTDGLAYQSLYHFGSVPFDGQFPYAGLALGNDGNLFGGTIGGGTNNRGTVYKIRPDGGGYQVLRQFGPSFGTNGAYLYGGLVVGSNNVLFGTTFSGGTSGFGNIFRLNPDGSGYQIIHQFGAGDGNGSYAGLVRGKDGSLFGSTSLGGANNQGTVFKIREDGTGYAVLASVGSGASDGRQIYQALAIGKDDALYGVTSSGGANNSGTLFRLEQDGTGYRTLFSFRTNEFASADLLATQAGEFFGALQIISGSETGTLFRFVIPSLLAIGADENGFQLQLSGMAGLIYTLETSSDLRTWDTWITTNLTASELTLRDTNAPVAARFYRVK
jgi:uncharacterized repeat protein (TIGR03803 family)